MRSDGRRADRGRGGKRPRVASLSAAAICLPVTPLGRALGLVPVPAAYSAYAAGVVGLYLVLVQGIKRRTMQRLLA